MSATLFDYHFLPVDGSLASLLLRFHTTKRAIFDATRQSHPEQFSPLDGAENWHPQPGTTIFTIPAPPDDLPPGVEWRLLDNPTDVGGTLGDILKKLAAGGTPAGRLGVGNTPEQCNLIFLDWRNRIFRENVLRRQAGVSGAASPFAALDKDLADPATAQIQTGDAICFPLNKLAAFAFPVAPSATSGTPSVATAEVGTGPLESLRQKLLAIKYAYLNLENMRREAQRIQAVSTRALQSMRNLRGLVAVQKDRWSNPLHPNDEGRGALVKALDDLIAKAGEAMLVPDAPNKVNPSLLLKWSWNINYLIGLLKQKETRELLDKVLATQADALFIADGKATHHQTVVDAASEIIAHAAFWVAEVASPSDATALLQAAADAMAAGKPPTAGSTTSVIDYVTSIVFLAKTNKACEGPAPIASCGAVMNAYTAFVTADVGAGRSEASELGEKLKKLDGALAKVLAQQVLAPLGLADKVSMKTYVGLGAELVGLDDEKVRTAKELVEQAGEAKEAIKKAAELTEDTLAANLKKAEDLQAQGKQLESGRLAMKTLKRFGSHDTAEGLVKLHKFENPRELFATLPKGLKSLSQMFGLAIAVANAKKELPSDAKATDYIKAAKSSVDAAAGVLKNLKEWGVLKQVETARVSALLGRLSLVLGIAIESAEAVEAFKGHDYMTAAGASLQVVAMVLFLAAPETGGVTLVVGAVVLVIGVALESVKNLKEMFTPNIVGTFDEQLKALKTGNAGHFPEVKEALEKVEAAFKAAKLYDFNDKDFEAYQNRLDAVGFARDGSLASPGGAP